MKKLFTLMLMISLFSVNAFSQKLPESISIKKDGGEGFKIIYIGSFDFYIYNSFGIPGSYGKDKENVDLYKGEASIKKYANEDLVFVGKVENYSGTDILFTKNIYVLKEEAEEFYKDSRSSKDLSFIRLSLLSPRK